MQLRVNYIGSCLYAQGPGRRYTIWVQGCSIHCPGCSNVDTWNPAGGNLMGVSRLADDIGASFDRSEIDGVTITGGEPLDQFKPVLELCRVLRPVSIFLTTGYTMARIRQREQDQILSYVDIICTGPFDQSKVCSGEYKGSSNQEIRALTKRGREQLLWPVVSKEVIVSPDGGAIETGFTV